MGHAEQVRPNTPSWLASHIRHEGGHELRACDLNKWKGLECPCRTAALRANTACTIHITERGTRIRAAVQQIQRGSVAVNKSH